MQSLLELSIKYEEIIVISDGKQIIGSAAQDYEPLYIKICSIRSHFFGCLLKIAPQALGTKQDIGLCSRFGQG